MKKLAYLLWLLPLYFVAMIGHQLWILNGMNQTYNEGESLIAVIEEVDIKQIAAQTNGYVDLRFTPASGEVIRERLTLSVQLAADVLESEVVAIRYNPESAKSIVMTPTHELNKRVIYSNLAMMGLSLLAVVVVAIGGTFFARRKEEALEFKEA